jgi:hypothetical protein
MSLTRVGPGILGAFLGALTVFLWLIFDWKILFLPLGALLGYLIGKLFESEELREKVRDLVDSLIR